MPYLGIFKFETLEKLLAYLKSPVSNMSKCIVFCKIKQTKNKFAAKIVLTLIWVGFLGVRFEVCVCVGGGGGGGVIFLSKTC